MLTGYILEIFHWNPRFIIPFSIPLPFRHASKTKQSGSVGDEAGCKYLPKNRNAVILRVLGYYEAGSKSLSITCGVYPAPDEGSLTSTAPILSDFFLNLLFESLALMACNLTFAVLKKKSKWQII